MSALDYNEALAALQQLEERDKLAPFEIGDLVHGLVATSTENVTKRIASDLGRSLAWVRQRDLVAKVFPPDARVELWGGEEPPPPVTWRHHWIAAQTDDPLGWITVAINEELSTRQLQEAIDGADPDTADDILITVDPGSAEIHVQFRQGVAAKVSDRRTPGVLTVEDSEGRILATRLKLPMSCIGKKVRLRRAR